MKRVKARKDADRRQFERAASSSGCAGSKGATVFHGHARFIGSNTVAVGGERLEADKIFFDVGGRPLVPKMPGIDQVPYLTNQSLMDVDFVPEHLIVVGGSYIGLEFGADVPPLRQPRDRSSRWRRASSRARTRTCRRR